VLAFFGIDPHDGAGRDFRAWCSDRSTFSIAARSARLRHFCVTLPRARLGQ